jgi:hypothetical protein
VSANGASNLTAYEGGCHCGAVRFEVDASVPVEVHQCNCSICELTGFLHLIVPAARFRLIEGAEQLTEYRFNTGTARHLFCSRCGIKSFYVPRSNPDGYSVNLRCLNGIDPAEVTVAPFDGRHWEDHAAELADLSRG